MPEREVFQEHWEFYDVDLNKVREDNTKGVDFARKMDNEKF